MGKAGAASSSDPTVASCLQSLGGIHRAMGSLGDARKCFEEALAIREQVLGPDDPLTAATLNNLGAVLQGLSDDRGAIRCYQKSLAIQMRAYGREHPTVAATLSNLGSAHGRIGEHQWAVDCHQRALNIQASPLLSTTSAMHLPRPATALMQPGASGELLTYGPRQLDRLSVTLRLPCIAWATSTAALATPL